MKYIRKRVKLGLIRDIVRENPVNLEFSFFLISFQVVGIAHRKKVFNPFDTFQVVAQPIPAVEVIHPEEIGILYTDHDQVSFFAK